MPAQQILLPLLRTYVIAMWIELLTLVFCQLLRDALSASSYLVGVDADDPGSIDCNCNCLEDSIPSAPPSISIPFLLPHEKGHASSNAIHIEQLLTLHLLAYLCYTKFSSSQCSEGNPNRYCHNCANPHYCTSESSFVLRLWMRQFPPQLRQSNPHLDQEKVRSIISELEQLLPHIASIYTWSQQKSSFVPW